MRFKRHRGVSLFYTSIILTLLVLLSSVAVDSGRLYLVKGELRNAADAAALAAAGELSNGVSSAVSAAQSIAAANRADGTSVVLENSDIEFGTWNPATSTFTALAGANRINAQAVRVFANRTAARGNPVQLCFASFLTGRGRICDVHASAIAAIAVQPSNFAIAGLDYIKLSGSTTQSYASYGAPPPASWASIASNGDITLSGGASIHGNAQPGVGKVVKGANRVWGTTTSLTQPLVFAPLDPGIYRTQNNNSAASRGVNGVDFSLSGSQSATFPGGYYYFRNFNTSGSSTVYLTGPVTIYCYGAFTMSGRTVTAGNLPGNLRIVTVRDTSGSAPKKVTLSGSSALYAQVYAPLSPVSISGSGNIYGAVIGKSIEQSGSAAITVTYDVTLGRGRAIGLVH